MPIFKKDDSSNYKNYKRITLLSTAEKLYEMALKLKAKIETQLDK